MLRPHDTCYQEGEKAAAKQDLGMKRDVPLSKGESFSFEHKIARGNKRLDQMDCVREPKSEKARGKKREHLPITITSKCLDAEN